MTTTRLTKTFALALIALVAFGGVADAKSRKHKPSARSWANSAVVTVLRTGAFPGVTVDSINANGDLDGPALSAFVMAALPKTGKRVRQIAPGRPVTLGDVDRSFVTALGMAATAARAEVLIARAGYVARPGVGFEIVARLMHMRTNLGQSDDNLEHAWYQQASRADAIWTAAQVIQFEGWEKQNAIDTVELLAKLPATSGPQHDAIQRGFDFIGMPYIWGGTSEKPQILFGYNTAGGFDCSGFVWRVTALDPTSPVGIAKALGGRTTFEMAATTPIAKRLSAAKIRPADVLLFGPGGINAQSSAIGHTGMAISSELFIQSSGQGIALARWDTGYYHDRLAFAKRVF